MKTISSVILSAFALLIMPLPSFSKVPMMLKEQKEMALFSCLSRNYSEVGANISEHEWSPFHPRYAALMERRNPEYDQKYDEFMKKNVGSFYKEEVPIHSEAHKRPYTAIFAKCVIFSESKALRDFITKNPL
jgi:hypothetical protein